MRAKRWLLEEARNESVILHVVDVFLLQSSFSAPVPKQQLVVGQLLHFFLGHGGAAAAWCCRRTRSFIQILRHNPYLHPLAVLPIGRCLLSGGLTFAAGKCSLHHFRVSNSRITHYKSAELRAGEEQKHGFCNEFHLITSKRFTYYYLAKIEQESHWMIVY